MIGIEGNFQDKEKQAGKCPEHPLCKNGSCGFYLDKPHGWQPEPVSTPNVHLSKEDHEDIVNWAVSHQVTNHHIVAMNEAQFKSFKRKDIVGIIELPRFVKKETPIQQALRSHEIPPIIA